MRIPRWIGAGLLLCFLSDSANATGVGVPGLIDRPTPPACCADGICYPNTTTWGTYPTRWRRWPGETLAPTPADGITPPQPTDLPPFIAPPKEEEERRAPPPTPEPEADEENGEVTRPPTTPPTTPPAETPDLSPITPPTTPPGNFQPPTRLPFEDDQPATPPQDDLPFGKYDSKGDHDPPPAPPFRTPSVAKNPAPRKAERPITSPDTAPRAAAPLRPSDADDPPPAFPLSLG